MSESKVYKFKASSLNRQPERPACLQPLESFRMSGFGFSYV